MKKDKHLFNRFAVIEDDNKCPNNFLLVIEQEVFLMDNRIFAIAVLYKHDS